MERLHYSDYTAFFGFHFVRTTRLKHWALVRIEFMSNQQKKKPTMLFFSGFLFSIVVFDHKELTRILALDLLIVVMADIKFIFVQRGFQV